MGRKSRRSNRPLAVQKPTREEAERSPSQNAFWAWNRDEAYWRGVLVALLAVGLGSALLLGPLLFSGEYPLTHEEFRYADLTVHFRAALADGIFYPRWLPDLAGGYGYPTFVFYQPLFFYVGSLFFWVPYSGGLAPLLAVGLFALLGSWGAYRVGRHFGDVWFGGAIAILFMLTPYLYANLYVRGDFSELAAMLLTPWPVHYLLSLSERLATGRTALTAAAGVAISLAAIVLAHPATALLYWPVAAALAAFQIVDSPQRKSLAGWVAGAFACGVALSAPYWLAVFTMRPYVNLDQAISGYFVASRHSVMPWQWVSRRWEFGGSIPDSAADGMSFQLGLPHLLLAIAGIWWGRRSILIKGAGAIYLVLLIGMSPLSNLLWDNIDLLKLVQFPWRILSVTAIIQAVCLGGLAEKWTNSGEPRARLKLGLAAIGISLLWYSNLFQIRLPDDHIRSMAYAHAMVAMNYASSTQRMEVHASMNEFCPRTADLSQVTPRGQEPLLVVPQSARRRQLPGHSQHTLRYEVELDEPGVVVINQFYFPGWKVVIDDVPVADDVLVKNLLPDGRMQIPLPAQQEVTLEAQYAGPPGGVLGWSLAAGGLLLGVFLGRYADRYKSRTVQPESPPAKRDPEKQKA